MELYQGHEFAKLNGYAIYQFNNNISGTYYLCMPSSQEKNYHIFVGFPTKNLNDLPKEEIIEQIKGVNDMLLALRKDTIYLIPEIPTEELEAAANKNDMVKFRQILNDKIQPAVFDAYQRITTNQEKDKSMLQMISIVEQKEADSKFVEWLKLNTDNFKHGITLDQIKKYYYARFYKKITPKNNVMNKPLDEYIMTDKGPVRASDVAPKDLNQYNDTERLPEDNTNHEHTNEGYVAQQQQQQFNNMRMVSNEEYAQMQNQTYEQSKPYTRTLTKPKPTINNPYGFINIICIAGILLGIITIAIMIGLLITKTRM